MDYALFPNVGSLSTFNIIKGVFSKYFSLNIFELSLKDQEYIFLNKDLIFRFFLYFASLFLTIFLFLLELNFAKNSENFPFELKIELTRHFFSLSIARN